MYRLTSDSADLLTEKAAYPSCQANTAAWAKVLWTQSDDRDFTDLINSAIDLSVRYRNNR